MSRLVYPKATTQRDQRDPSMFHLKERFFDITYNLLTVVVAITLPALLAPSLASAYGVFQTLEHQVTGLEGLSKPGAAVLSPDGLHLYVGGVDALVVLERDPSSGALEALQTLQSGGDGFGVFFISHLVASPDGRNIYAASTISSALLVFERDPETGHLTFVQRLFDHTEGVDGLGKVFDLEISPDGRHLFSVAFKVLPASQGKVAVFERNLTDGSLTLIDLENEVGAVSALYYPLAVAIAPDGSHLYVADRVGGLLTFDRDPGSGELTFRGALAGEPLGVSNAIDLVLDPEGAFLYLAGHGDFSPILLTFSRDPESGVLTLVDSISSMGTEWEGTENLLIDGDGLNLYMRSRRHLDVFARDSQGRLQYRETVRDDEQGVEGLAGIGNGVLSPQNEHLYVPAYDDEAMVLFMRSASTGELTFLDAMYDGEGATLDAVSRLTSPHVRVSEHMVLNAEDFIESLASVSKPPQLPRWQRAFSIKLC